MTKHEQIKAMTVDQFANYLLNNGFGLLKKISKEQTPDQWRYWMEHFVNWLNSETELDPKELEKCTEWRMKAKWVKARFDVDKGRYVADETKKRGASICSACKEPAYDDSDYGYQLFPYCPWCGAEMENPDD